MAAIKLTYLDYKGRAELLRFILAQAGVEFQDNRIKPEKWAEEMPGTEFGIPVLECEENVLKSNATISKFLAKKYSLEGCSDEEVKATEEILNTTEETWNKMSKFFWEKDPAKKAEAMKELTQVHLPVTLKKLTETVVKNGSGWVVGDNATYADFAVTVLLDALSKYKPEIVGAFPALGKLKTRVESLPNIAKWIANRPDSSN